MGERGEWIHLPMLPRIVKMLRGGTAYAERGKERSFTLSTESTHGLSIEVD
jgi:hypothetical protein